MFNDTIAAVSTANAMGAVSIIRISGEEAIAIASKLIGKDLSNVKGYTIHYGTVKENGNPVDEVLVSVFRAPRSYTGEDVIELSVHGGTVMAEACGRSLENSAMAEVKWMKEQGHEFTVLSGEERAAFLQGMLDNARALLDREPTAWQRGA